MLVGNVVALLSPVVLIPIFTLIFGIDKYDWASMLAIKKGDDHDLATQAGIDIEEIPGGHEESREEYEAEQSMLRRALKIAVTTTVTLTLAFLILWPMPMYGSKYIFSKPFFTGWVTVGIIWIFCSFFAVGLFPVWEGRETIVRTVKSMISGRKPSKHSTVEVTEGQERVASGTVTPEKKIEKESVVY
jgi:hypothetical protein